MAFAAFFYQVVRPLALPLFLAAVFALLAHPLYEWLTPRCGGRARLSALLILLSMLVVLVAPMVVGFLTAYQRAQEAVDFIQQSSFDTSRSDKVLHWLARLTKSDPKTLHTQMTQAVRDAERLLFQRALQAVGDLFSFGLAMVLFLISAFFFLKDGRAIVNAWDDLTPLDIEQDRKIRGKFVDLCRGVMLSTILAALAQTIAVGIALVLLDIAFGLHLASWIPLLVVLTAVGAMIPMLGAATIWVPVSLWLLYRNHYAAGIILILYGTILVSNVDNLIRMSVLKGAAEMHPLLTLISVIGGVELMGVIGAFIGPIVAGVFVTLLLILKQQLDEIEGPSPPSAAITPDPIRSESLAP